MEQITNLVIELIKGFVENPDAVETYTKDDKDEAGDIVVLHVKVDKADIGVCIGKSGEHAKALRTIIGLVGYKQLGKRVFVKIDAPQFPKNHFEYKEK